MNQTEIKAPSRELLEKYDHLKEHLVSLRSVAVAFSGGVDSTFLLYAASEALPPEKLIAVTSSTRLVPARELKEAKAFCASLGVRHFICESDELEIEGFAENPVNRCYICKTSLFQAFLKTAREQEMAAVIEGSNLDDLGDYRPGLQAITELGIQSPLRTVGFTKQEIRQLSAYYKLPTWNKPSFACLASRIPYGETITAEKLTMAEKAEQLLYELGFQQYRVRIHGKIARIELLPQEFPKLMEEETRERICSELKSFGFAYVTLDLQGYRTGSLNETIEKSKI